MCNIFYCFVSLPFSERMYILTLTGLGGGHVPGSL